MNGKNGQLEAGLLIAEEKLRYYSFQTNRAKNIKNKQSKKGGRIMKNIKSFWPRQPKMASPLIIFLFVFVSIFYNLLLAQEVQIISEKGAISRIERLRGQIEQVARRIRGDVGVAIKHLESGEMMTIRGDEFFPMASVFKIPILVEVMAQIKEGRFRFDDMWSFSPVDLHLGSGLLSSLEAPGISLSVRNIIYLMMLISDNSATDLLLSKIGVENVNRRLRSYGLEGIMVNRSCQELILEYRGLNPQLFKNLTLKEIEELYRREREISPETFEQARRNFSMVMKDQSTPLAMNKLLELLATGQILDKESCDFIIEVMLRCQTGERRLKGNLPPGVRVAHKTGTIGGTVNDAGLIFLPYDLGRVAITVFIKNADDEKTEDVEEVIAQIARFAYDYFLFTSGN